MVAPIYRFVGSEEKICVRLRCRALSNGSVTTRGRSDPGAKGRKTMVFGRKKRAIMRLLVVEDEPLVAFDNEHSLTEEGFEVVATVDRVADAIAVLDAKNDIHLVLADVSLPDGSGIDIARHAHARGIAVIFCTGECPEGGRPFARGCLAKPYRPADLIAAIAAVDGQIQGRKAPRRLPRGFSLFEQPVAA
jgi:CheY-like chemotaxis protein